MEGAPRGLEEHKRVGGSVLLEGVEGGQGAAELDEASSLTQRSEVDGGEAELGGQVSHGVLGIGVVAGENSTCRPASWRGSGAMNCA